MSCPLCGHDGRKPSWVGCTHYQGARFEYVACRGCGTLYCDPMPDAALLAQMYGVDYRRAFDDAANVDDPKQPGRTLAWLRRLGTGAFVDYGCGDGTLLRGAAGLSWRACGVELDPHVARRTEEAVGVPVVSDPAELARKGAPRADVVHMGDVIEHLTDLDRQLPCALELLKPEGLLLAQGPLEANASLFTFVLKLAHTARRRRGPDRAPYHVLLATARGQRALFRRFGLVEVQYDVHEVCWPAPSRLSWADLKRPRAVLLFALRQVSLLASKLIPGRLGNRYYYAGRRPAGTDGPADRGALVPC